MSSLRGPTLKKKKKTIYINIWTKRRSWDERGHLQKLIFSFCHLSKMLFLHCQVFTSEFTKCLDEWMALNLFKINID